METAFYCAEQTGRQISLVGRQCIVFTKLHDNVDILKAQLNQLIQERLKISQEKKLYIYDCSWRTMGAMMRISKLYSSRCFIEKGDAVIFLQKLYLVMKNFINFIIKLLRME